MGIAGKCGLTSKLQQIANPNFNPGQTGKHPLKSKNSTLIILFSISIVRYTKSGQEKD